MTDRINQLIDIWNKEYMVDGLHLIHTVSVDLVDQIKICIQIKNQVRDGPDVIKKGFLQWPFVQSIQLLSSVNTIEDTFF